MAKDISQRELRNNSGDIMRGLDRGESFILTRNGMPVGEVRPLRRRRFVRSDSIAAMFAVAPPVDAVRFRADVDAIVDQNPAPHG